MQAQKNNSSIRKKITLLTSASLLALLSSQITESYAGTLRQMNDKALTNDLSKGQGFLKAGPYQKDDIITIFDNFNNTTTIFDVNNETVRGFINQSGQGQTHSIQITESATIGSMVTYNNSKPSDISFAGTDNLTLSGQDFNFSTGPNANRYDVLGDIDFQSTGSTLTINALNKNKIELKNTSVTSAFKATINVLTPTAVDYAKFAGIGHHFIDSEYTLDDLNSNALSLPSGSILFNSASAHLILSSNGGNVTPTISVGEISPAADGLGTITLRDTLGNGVLQISTPFTNIGVDQNNRLGTLKIDGANKFAFGDKFKTVYVKNIDLSNQQASQAIFFGPVVMGADGVLQFNNEDIVTTFDEGGQLNTINFNHNYGNIIIRKQMIVTGKVNNSIESTMHFAENERLEFLSDLDRTFENDFTIAPGSAQGKGTIFITGFSQKNLTHNFKGKVGDPFQAETLLHELDLSDYRGDVNLQNDSAIYKARIGANATVNLLEQKNYRVDLIEATSDGVGKVVLGDVQFQQFNSQSIGTDIKNRLGTLELNNKNSLIIGSGKNYIKNVNLNGVKSDVTFPNQLEMGPDSAITFLQQDLNLILDQGGNVETINSSQNNKIVFGDQLTITGNIGGDASNEIFLKKQATLELLGNLDRTIDTKIGLDILGATGNGTIKVNIPQNKIVTFNNAIGQPTTGTNFILNSLTIQSGTVELNKASGIHKIEFTNNSDGIIKLSEQQSYRIENITTSKDGSGTLEINNNNIALIEDVVSGTVKIGANGASLKAIDFKGDFILNLPNNTDIYTSALSNSSGSGKGKIVVLANTSIRGGSINTQGISEIFTLGQGALTMAGKYAVDKIIHSTTNALVIEDGFELNGEIWAFSPFNPGQQDIKITGSAIFNGNVGINGTNQEKFRTISVEGGKTATFKANVNTEDFNIDKNSTAEFAGKLTTDKLQLLSPDSTARFLSDGAVFDLATIHKAGEGQVQFNGSTNVNAPLGKLANHLKQIDFVANGGGNKIRKDININIADLYADTSNFHTVNVIPNQNTTLTGGNANFTDTTFTLGTNSFATTLTGNAVLSGTMNINTSVNNNDIGDLLFNAGNNVDFTNINQVNVNIDAAAGTTSTANPLNIVVANGANGNPGLNVVNGNIQLTRTNAGDLAGWTVNVSGNNILLTPPAPPAPPAPTAPPAPVVTTGTAQAPDAIVTTGTIIGSDVATVSAGGVAVISSGDIAENIAQTTNSGNASTHLSSVQNTANNALTSHVQGVMSYGGFGAGSGFVDSEENAENINFAYDDASMGVSAGSDEILKNGIWFTPFYNDGTQKKRGTTPGHETETYGGTVGIDRHLNEHSLIGAAFTYTDTEMSHKGQNSSDKTNIDTYMGAIYGLYQFDPHWFVHGMLSYAGSEIKSKITRRVVGGTSMASSKHRSHLYSSEVIGGYHYQLNHNVILTPNFGAAYTYHDSKAHEETGTSENHKIGAHDTQKIDLIAGLRMRAKMYESGNRAVYPHLHAIVRYDLKDDKNAFDVSPIGTSGGATVTNSVQGTRTVVNLGAGIDFKYGITTFTISYDAHIATKYLSHHGALKLRVNF